MNKPHTSFSFLFLLFFIAHSNIVLSQSLDSTEYKQFKRILPFVLKNITSGGQAGMSSTERVQDVDFLAPWEMKKFDESQINKFIATLQSDTNYELKEARRGDHLNLNIYSTLQNFRQEPELKKEFQNLIIEISNFNIKNENGEDIYLSENKNALQPKLDGKQQITLQGAQFNCLIPISSNHTNLSGSLDLQIIEKSNFVYHEISKSNKPNTFDLNGISIELIKVDGNSAFFKSSSKIENLKITSVNDENKKHRQTSVLQLPEKIYLKGKEENLSDEDITAFVDDYSMEEFNRKSDVPTIIIYQSSGDIGTMYLYQITKKTERAKCTLDFKL